MDKLLRPVTFQTGAITCESTPCTLCYHKAKHFYGKEQNQNLYMPGSSPNMSRMSEKLVISCSLFKPEFSEGLRKFRIYSAFSSEKVGIYK